MEWDDANPGGKPIAYSDGVLTAKVTFTGLPEHNYDFGWKTVRLLYNCHELASNPYGVFFDKDAMNYPNCHACLGCPNWFYYWYEGEVCEMPVDSIYDATHPKTSLGYVETEQYGSIIFFCAGAAGINLPSTYHARTDVALLPEINYPSITAGGNGLGIKCVAETIQHEKIHINNYQLYRSAPQLIQENPDMDGDHVPDILEVSGFMSVHSATNHPNTYNLKSAYPESRYDDYGDEEIRCRLHETPLTIPIFPEKDWANPGSQHINKFGPDPE